MKWKLLLRERCWAQSLCMKILSSNSNSEFGLKWDREGAKNKKTNQSKTFKILSWTKNKANTPFSSSPSHPLPNTTVLYDIITIMTKGWIIIISIIVLVSFLPI